MVQDQRGPDKRRVFSLARSLSATLDAMSDVAYALAPVEIQDKLLRWLHGEVKTPPFSRAARLEAGFLLRRLQQGESIALPHSRPMPSIGARWNLP